MKTKKKEFSKKLCLISIAIIIISIIIAIIFSAMGLNTEIFTWVVPSAGTICSVCLGFYFNKSKVENLSKQRIRTELMRLVLQQKLTPEDYEEICDDLDHIDGTIENKISQMYENAVEEETEINLN